MSERAAAASGGRTAFIPEIQGLRTLALLLVAVFHIWFDRVSGGVDVFLVISAYLMTRSLVARSETGAPVRPLVTVIRKFSRLVPAAAATVLLTLLAAYVLLPTWRLPSAAADALASLAYVENWHLQAVAADYFAADKADASLFQHFWSLSIQGQAFLVIPLLHAVGAFLSRRSGRPLRATLIVMFATVFAASFGWAVWLTSFDQTYAYFDTGARMWEFAGGSLLALIQPRLRLPDAARAGMSWLGVAGVVTCGLVIPVEGTFPGFAALWPFVSTALVLFSAGGPPPRFGAHRMLSIGVFQSFAKYSYALYLTHWPVLVIFLLLADIERPSGTGGLLILLLAIGSAMLIEHAVERRTTAFLARSKEAVASPVPLRNRMRPVLRPIAVIVVLTTVGAVSASVLRNVTARSDANYLDFIAEADLREYGANAADVGLTPPALPVTREAAGDTATPGEDCDGGRQYAGWYCHEVAGAEPGAEMRRIYAVGNSHMLVSAPFYLDSVREHGDRFARTEYVWGCEFEHADEVGRACTELWDAAAEYIRDTRPDLVILYGTRSGYEGEKPQWGLVDWAEARLEDSPDTQFVFMRDTPRFTPSLIDCALELGFDSDACVREHPRSDLADFVATVEQSGFVWLDMTDLVCPEGLCRPTVGGLVVYMDRDHITNVFSRTMATAFDHRIGERIDWWNAL